MIFKQNKEMDSALLGLNKRCQDFWVTKHQDEEGSWAAEAATFCFQSGSNYLNYLNYPNYPYVSPGTGSPARNWDHQNSAGVGRKPNWRCTARWARWVGKGSQGEIGELLGCPLSVVPNRDGFIPKVASQKGRRVPISPRPPRAQPR